jgi:hypothetical protein
VVLSINKALAENELEAAYQRMPAVDLSREILVPQPHRLLAIRDATSGWTGWIAALNSVADLASCVDFQNSAIFGFPIEALIAATISSNGLAEMTVNRSISTFLLLGLLAQQCAENSWPLLLEVDILLKSAFYQRANALLRFSP